MFLSKRPNKFFYILTIAVFLVQLVLPTAAYAEGETPTPEPAAVSAPADAAPSDAAPTDAAPADAAPAASETPAPTEAPLDLTAVPDGTDVVVLDESGQVLPLGSEAAADVIALGDPKWCPVGDNPETSLNCTTSRLTLQAVLDDIAGLGTDVAGVIWILGNPTDASAISKDLSAKTAALTIQGGWTGTGSGISATPSTFTVPLSIFWGGQLTINNLTLDGTTAGNVEAMLNVDAGGAVALNNVSVTHAKGLTGNVDENAVLTFTTGTQGYGAKINSDAGGVTVANSTFSYNNHSGLTITSAGPVTLNSVTAHGNGGQRDLTSGEITAVEAAHHAGMLWDVDRWVGINLDNLDANGHVIDGDTYYKHVWWGSGVDVLASAGNVLVQDSQFGLNTNAERNNDNGLIVEATSGNITLDGVTADGNFNSGADLTAQAGTIQVTDSYFLNTREYSNSVYVAGPGCTGPDDLCGWGDWNYYDYPSDPSNPDNSDATTADWLWGVVGYGGTGLSAKGSSDITLTGVNAATPGNGNEVFGAQLFSWGGDIAITDSEFNSNSYTGLYANSGSKLDGDQEISGCYNVSTGNALNGGCDITLTNVTADDNGAYGAELYAEAGGIKVQKNANGSSKFTLNDGTGLYAKAGTYSDGCPAGAVCGVTLNDVSLLENGSNGADVNTYNGNLNISNMTATDNGREGLYFEQGYGYDGLFSGSLIMTTGTNTFRFNGGNGLETSMDNGNVTISGGTFNENDSDGLNIYIGAGDVTLTGGTFDQNDSDGVDITIDAGNLTLTGGTFDENYDSGLQIETGIGDISLTNIEGNDNSYSGAELYTVEGGNVTVSNSFFNGNSEDNIYAETGNDNCDNGTCNITITNVQANDSTDGHGIHLYTYNGGDVTINGGTFNGNDLGGIYAETGSDNCDNGTCNITLTNIEGNDNDGDGAELYAYYGNITISNSVFNGNLDADGIYAETGYEGECISGSGCGITLDGVTANNNQDWGGEFMINTDAGSDSPVEIKSSTFNANDSGGLLLGGHWGLSSDGVLPTFWLTNVTANGNGNDYSESDGLQFLGPQDLDGYDTTGSNAEANLVICSGSYSNNTGFGLNIDNFGGTITLGGSVVTSGNLGDLLDQNWLNPKSSLGDCEVVVVHGDHKVIEDQNSHPTHEGDFSCETYNGLRLDLIPGDYVEIPCTSRHGGKYATAFNLAATSLPAQPEGSFISALHFTVEDSQDHTIGQVLVSFKLPAGSNPGDYSILYWDGHKWVKMDTTVSLEGNIQAWSNLMGFYVLVKN